MLVYILNQSINQSINQQLYSHNPYSYNGIEKINEYNCIFDSCFISVY